MVRGLTVFPSNSAATTWQGLSAGYGEAIVLTDVSFTIERRQAMALLGRNGTGKTTLINSVIGHTRWRAGSVHLSGVDTTALRPDQRALAGIGWVPQERNIFKSLTVQMALSPQCGFSSTVHGNAIAVEAQRAKLALVVDTANDVWGSG